MPRSRPHRFASASPQFSARSSRLQSTSSFRWIGASWRVCVGAIGLLVASSAPAATSVSQHGITWTFDADHRTGQFVTGDWWVIGPVTIVSISPADPDPTDDIDVHGSVVNPMPVRRSPYTQSLDSRVGNGTTYRRDDNVARQLPLRLQPGSSLLSVRSRDEVGSDKLILSDGAVLTVLDEVPPPNSFRPPYAGTDKSIPGQASQLDLTIFRSLPRVRSAPSLSSLDRLFNQPLIDLITQWPNSSLKTANAGAAYGRDIAREVGDAVLALNLDYPESQKRPLVIKLVQRGLDTYGLAAAGMVWTANGGHNTGRKLPLLIAARALHRSDILAYGDGKRHLIFQEDQQHWFISATDVRLSRGKSDRAPYTPEMIGVPEWTENPIHERNMAGSQWNRSYRYVNGSVNTGLVLAAELMGLRPLWNWDPLFAYITERYYPQESTNPTNAVRLPGFHVAMWEAYRDPKAATKLPPMAHEATPSDRLLNLSTRGRISGSGELVTGFVLQGSRSRDILVRAVGPGLRAFGVDQNAAGLRFTLFREGDKIVDVSNWGAEKNAADLIAASQRVGAFGLSDQSQDSAAFRRLEPGSYSVHVTANDRSGGVALVEVYDAGEEPQSAEARLINLSTRGHVGRGEDLLITGVTVGGTQAKRLLIRAVGPGLRPHGVTGVLADPLLRLMSGGREIAVNDDWDGSGEVAAAAGTVGAFPLPAGSKDAALVVTLSPGNYTAQVVGHGSATGVAMIEVYEIP